MVRLGGDFPVSLSEEIAAAQGALVALSRASGAGTSSSPQGRRGRGVDASWLALEDRVATRVASLYQQHGAEQLEATRVLRASVTRIESRVRAAEAQGVRCDRRDAELQGIVQALAEEQRALLIRLDRLDGPGSARSILGPPAPRDALHENGSGLPEEALRRLGRLEREQRGLALNLRLVVSRTEEAAQRQQSAAQTTQQQVSRTEELLDARLQALEEAFHLREPAAAIDGNLRASAGAWGKSPACLREELCAAEMPFSHSLEAAERLLKRCEGKSLDFHNLPTARKSAAGSDAGGSIAVVSAAEALRKVEWQGARIVEMSNRVADLPTHDAVRAACRQAADGQQEVIDDVRATLERLNSRLQSVDAQVDALVKQNTAQGADRCAELNDLRARVETAIACRRSDEGTLVAQIHERLKETIRCEGGASMDDMRAHAQEFIRTECSTAVADVRARLEHLVRNECGIALADLRKHQQAVVRSECGTMLAHVRANLEDSVQNQCGTVLADVQTRLEDSLQRAEEALSRRSEALSEELAGIRGQLISAISDVPPAAWSPLSEDQCGGGASLEPLEGSDQLLELGREDLFAEVSELRDRCDSLQEVVEQQVLVALWEIDRQLPETARKLATLVSEQNERAAGLEEHEVRLNLALARQSRNEERLAQMSERMERQPGVSQTRSLWREDIQRQLAEADVPGLRRRLETQEDAAEELRETLGRLGDRIGREHQEARRSDPWLSAPGAQRPGGAVELGSLKQRPPSKCNSLASLREQEHAETETETTALSHEYDQRSP